MDPIARGTAALGRAASARTRGALGAARAHAERALEMFAARARDPAATRGRLDALDALGGIHNARGDYREAERVLRAAIALARSLLDARAAANPLVGLGVALKFQGRLDDAEAAYRAALGLVGARTAIAATIAHNLGGLDHARGRFARAERHARRGIRIRAQLAESDPIALAEDRAALAAILDARGAKVEAEQLYRAVIAELGARLGRGHPEVGFNLGQLAALVHSRGERAAASALYVRALRIKTRALGAGHPDVALTRINLGVLRAQQGREREALRLFRHAEAALIAALGPDHPDVMWCRSNRAALTDA